MASLKDFQKQVKDEKGKPDPAEAKRRYDAYLNKLVKKG